jgi:hypothetical protein
MGAIYIYIITRYIHMLITSGVEKKSFKAKPNILYLLCIFLSASLFYVVGMAYKKAYKSTNRLIDPTSYLAPSTWLILPTLAVQFTQIAL